MSSESIELHGHLRRLTPEAYRGRTIVHWNMAMDKRVKTWLDDVSHATLREIFLHTCVEYSMLCPTYCLMPDHFHLLFMGTRQNSDQRLAIAFLRRHCNAFLSARYHARLQTQAYDHVLKEKERERGAFESVAHYILDNPVRAGLAPVASGWPCSGCVVLGHPAWHVFSERYWDSFWKVYAEACET